MNQQGLLWNLHYVATVVVRKQINFQSTVIRSKRSSCLVLLVSRPKLPLSHIVSGTSNHVTYDVYSPKSVKTLMYLKFYEYSTLYLKQNILLFCAIEALDSKRVLNTKKAITSFMECVDVATFAWAVC